VRHWCHLRLGRLAPGGLAAFRGPQRCDIVAVRTATMSHRCGWRRCHRRGRIAAGGADGASAAGRAGVAGGVRTEPPPGRPALAGRQLTPQEPRPGRIHAAKRHAGFHGGADHEYLAVVSADPARLRAQRWGRSGDPNARPGRSSLKDGWHAGAHRHQGDPSRQYDADHERRPYGDEL
jgi:hypothetical protein